MFPPCTPGRIYISVDEYDRLRLAEIELLDLKRGRPQTLGEWARETFDPPEPKPVYNRTPEGPYKHRGEWLRKMCAAYHRGHQAEPTAIQADQAPEWLRALTEPAQDDPVPAWLQALAIEPAATYRPLTGSPARPPDRTPGEKPKPRKMTRKTPKTGKKAAAGLNVTAEFTRVKRRA